MTAFDDKIKSLIANQNNLTDDEIKKVFKLLDDIRKTLISRLIKTKWDAFHLPQMDDVVEKAMLKFGEQFKQSMKSATGEAWASGTQFVESPMITNISTSNLVFAQGYTADLITNTIPIYIKKITDAVTMGVMGGKSFQEVMKEVGANLDDPSVFRTIAARSEFIARTEMGRIHSNAAEMRFQEVRQYNPDIVFEKVWIHSGRINKYTRKNHFAINNVAVEVDMDFSKAGKRSAVPAGMGMAYPHAPGLDAGEVVNCRCVHVYRQKVAARDLQPGMALNV